MDQVSQISGDCEKTSLGEKSVQFGLYGKTQLTGKVILFVEAYP